LHNDKNYASLPIDHSVHLKQTYDNLELVLTKLEYTVYDWVICGDLKLSDVLGQQADYIKHPCFKCEWESRARSKHWKQKHWTLGMSLEPGGNYILRKSLFDPKKILLPRFHIKLGIMKQSVTAVTKIGFVFSHLCKTFLICRRPNWS
jgi:hypothetical protein